MKHWQKNYRFSRVLSILLALVMLIGLLPMNAFAAGGENTASEQNPFAGKTVSILGDSISTFTGVSNNTAYNPTLGGGWIYYNEGTLGISRQDTWWQQAIDSLGMELLVNNSWSGSCIFTTRCGTVGAYVDRCVQLHNTAGEEPDIIAVYLGTNDFCNFKPTLGTADAINYDTLIIDSENGYTYAAPATAAEAYAIMLHKMMKRYPDAEIYCFTLLPQRNLSAANQTLLEQFNESIRTIAAHFDAALVDLYSDSGIQADDQFQSYIADNDLHPGPTGMDAITGCFVSSLWKNSRYVDGTVYDVTYDLTDVIVDQGTAKAVLEGESFHCSFTVPAGCELSVTVTMDGVDITSSVYANGVVNISGVTGDVVITATGREKTVYEDHLQQLPDNICAGTNLWTVLEPENLYYDVWGWTNLSTGQVWSVTIPVSAGDRLYANSFKKHGENGNDYSSEDGIRVAYFHADGTVQLFTTAETYAEYSANGYLTVPNGAVAVTVPMWNNDSSSELYILNREHSYKSTVTAPTCTERGYTTHTCTICGDTYVDSYVDVVWHSYEDGCCSMCGCNMLRVTLDDIIQYQGGVNSENGILNTTFTNNWYTDIRIPQGAEQVRVLTFKTGANWGGAFFSGTTYLSGFCDPNVGGQWITVDIPEEATVLRYGYLYDEIAQKNGWPLFQYVEFAGEELEPLEPSQYMERPATGCHSFSVEVNIAPAMGDPDGYTMGTDYGYIMLPTNYTSYGEPTRLIIDCHGAGVSLSTYQSSAWNTPNYSFWTDLGYAVMDMYACPQELTGNGSCLHYGNPVVLDCYKAGYEYVMEHFNLKQDGIYVIGTSMGGLSSFQLVQSGEFPVLAQVGYCPVIDLFKQAYCNPWTTPSYQRSRIASYFGFAGTLPTFTNSKYPSAEEIEYYRQNFSKTIPYSPIVKNVVTGDVDSIFDVIPSSAVATDAAEAALYGQFTATHPCPVMIFHNTDDRTVSYRYSQYFVDMVNRSGQEAMLYTFTSGAHNAWANGDSVAVQGINGQITIKESQYQAYLFFDKYEKHAEHLPWVDPAVAPTCTEAGLTEGSHCAVCGEVIVAQTVVGATGHSYASVVTAPTCTEQGYTTHTCHCGDSYVDTFVNATGHNFGDWYETKAPTEATQGEKRRDCVNCDHFEITPVAALTHDHNRWETIVLPSVAPTCTATGLTEGKKCSGCGEIILAQEIVPALSHSFGAWAQTKAPTCTETGIDRRDCQRCDHYETRDVNSLGHDLTQHTAKDATCTEIGWNAYETCSRCDYSTYAELPATGHSYKSVVTKPTCTEQGYTTHTCTICGDSYVDSYVDALGHDLIQHSTKAPTCTEIGWNAYETCSRCDHTTYVEIPEAGHSYKSVVTNPTCTEQGYTTYTCACGDSYVDGYVNALGHDFKLYVPDGNATCTEDGTKTAKCERCKITDTAIDSGSAFGHSYTDQVIPPTLHSEGYTLHVCTVCQDSFKDNFTDKLTYTLGDTDDNGQVNSDDAIYLLKHSLFPDAYPINQESDFDGSGTVNSDDAIYLLKHTLFPDMYPLYDASVVFALPPQMSFSSCRKEDDETT